MRDTIDVSVSRNRWKIALLSLLATGGVITAVLVLAFAGLRSADAYAQDLLKSFAAEGAAAPSPALASDLNRSELEELQVKMKETGAISSVDNSACFIMFEHAAACGFGFYKCVFQGKIPTGRFSATTAICPAGISKPMALLALQWKVEIANPPPLPASPKSTAL